MKKILSLLLCVLILCSALCVAVGAKNAPVAAAGKFVPVLRFIAASDTHVRDEGDFTCERIEKMMEETYRLAAQDAAHPTLDALLLAGDVTDDGNATEFEKLENTLHTAVKSETKLLAIAAKNHDGYHMSREDERNTIAAITGNDADFHVVINGYHFIGLSVSSKWLSHYDKGQLNWLKEQLDAATAEKPNQPVFVMHHEHVKNTVYGSSSFERWGVPYFNDILEQYPQVVDFSGHSHYPLNHPNSVWQGAFTAINTGAVKSTDYTVEDMRDIASYPDNRKCSTYWIVELDAANRMHLRGMDLLAGKVLCEYTLDNPADSANRDFAPEKKAAASTAPVFSEGALREVAAQSGGCTITVNNAQSTDGMPVVLYRAYAIDENGKEIAKTWTMPQYYITDAPDTVELTLKGLGKGTYTLKVVAETAYGVQSAPLQTELTLTSPSKFSALITRTAMRVWHVIQVIWNAIV